MYTCGYQDVVMVYLRSDLALSSSSREDIERMCVDNLLADPEERIFFKDLESRFLLVSAGWLAALTHGLSLAEVVSKTDFDIFSGPHATNAFADEQRVIETGQPMVARVERETFHDRPDIWVSTTKWPLRDVDGNIVGTWGISRDITAQVEAEQALATSHEQLRASERQHRMLFEHNPQPMFAYDRATLRIVAVSDSAVASYGYSREEFLTLTIKDVMPREDHESLERFLETTVGGEGCDHRGQHAAERRRCGNVGCHGRNGTGNRGRSRAGYAQLPSTARRARLGLDSEEPCRTVVGGPRPAGLGSLSHGGLDT